MYIMAKKKINSVSVLHNVYLLYGLFIAALLHLGYFVFTQDSLLLVSFSLAAIFVYLVNPNMIIVLATSIVFVDMLYLVKKVPEGFDPSGNSVDSVDSQDGSGNEPFTNGEPQSLDTEQKPLTFVNLLNKVNEIRMEDFKATNSTGDVVNSSGTNEKVTGKSIQEVNQESKQVSSILSKVKNSNPEMAESLLQVNSIDINQLNTLINNLNDVAKTIKTNGV